MEDSLKNKLGRLQGEDIGEKERKRLLSVFHQGDVEYEVKQELFNQLQQTTEIEEDKESSRKGFYNLWNRIESFEESKKKRTIQLGYVYWAAAVLLIGFILGNIIQINISDIEQNDYYTAIAPKGSISETILPDGTIIFLNAGSKVKYYTGNEDKREVFLEGEAWFDVTKSKLVPFIVHTSSYDVRVTGTQFNVRAYEDDREVVTTLEEGEVRIQSSPDFKIEDEIRLSPGDQLVYSKEKKFLRIAQVQTQNFTSWKNNKLIFINMSLKELITLLERKYGVDIAVPDKDILKYHYDGSIKNETIIEVLNILQKTLPIHYVIRDQEIVIYKK